MRSVRKQVSLRKKSVRKSHGSKPAKSAALRKIASKGTGKRDPHEPGVSQLKPAEKRSRDRVPPPQRERIKQKYVKGKGIAEISREEKRNRETVAKIVKSDEMRAYVLQMRERFYALSDTALATLGHAIESEKYAHVAYKVLTDSGVIPTPLERMQALAEKQTPSDREAVCRIIEHFIGHGITLNRAYGIDMSEDEERLARAGGRVDENGRIVPLETPPDQPIQSAIESEGTSKKASSEKRPRDMR